MVDAADRTATDEEPDVFAPELMARVRQIQIHTHRLVSDVLAGAYKSSLRGTGIEFEEVRPYQPGDDTRAIDWNVTARTGEPFIKTYREERQLTLHLLVDTSASMDFGSARATKREIAAEFCALLAFVAAQARDPVGLTLFDDEPGLYLTPGQGPRHVLRLVREIVAARPQPVTQSESSGLGASLEQLGRLLRRRALVFVVGDFLDERYDEWSQPLLQLAQRHDVIAVRVVDPLEIELPSAGWLALRGLEEGRVIDVDTSSARVRKAWANAASERTDRLRSVLTRARVEEIELSTAGEVADPVVRFFQARQRRRVR